MKIHLSETSSIIPPMCCWQSDDGLLYDLSRDPIEKKEGFIPWDKFVNLLEGFEVTLPALMNRFSENVVIKKKMPV